MSKALAIKYRPTTFEDLTEQSAVVKILTNQIETGTIKHGYLFCGGAGTGKTTSARIFASMINKGLGMPIELDAASNNSVDDVRRLSEDAQTQALESEYKVFIIDECHSLSSQAWQAFLKTLEEPPAKSIFIFCTTNPEKIPQTILSRVQRYNFQRISFDGIVKRLEYIVNKEQNEQNKFTNVEKSAIEYIAKIADGGMRDAITLLDKCLSYNEVLSMDNVIAALGVADYETMFALNEAYFDMEKMKVISIINEVYNSGMDLKLFVKTYFEFLLDLNVYAISGELSNTKIPVTWQAKVEEYDNSRWQECYHLLTMVMDLLGEIKWEQNPKVVILAKFIIDMESEE